MAFSRSAFERPPKPAGRGRPKKTTEPISIWLLAMHFIKPGIVKRKARYQACLQNANVRQAAVVKALGVEERSLIDYVEERTARVSNMTLLRRQQLAQLICGDAACEPWLTNGTWTTSGKKNALPAWLAAADIESTTKLFVRWMVLAIYRARASRVGSILLNDPIALEFLHYSGQKATAVYGNDKAWTPTWWTKNSTELAAASAEAQAAFAAFLSAMKSFKIWHHEFINLMPFEVGRAYEAFLWEQRQAISASDNRRPPRGKPLR